MFRIDWFIVVKFGLFNSELILLNSDLIVSDGRHLKMSP